MNEDMVHDALQKVLTLREYRGYLKGTILELRLTADPNKFREALERSKKFELRLEEMMSDDD